MRRSLLAVMRKELRQTFRDRRMAAMLVLAPVLQLTLMGYAVDLDVDHVPTAICDRDHSDESRALVRRLLADGTLVNAGATDHPAEPLTQGWAEVVLVLPRGLARELDAGRPVRLQALVDGSDPTRSQAAEAMVRQAVFARGLELATQRMQHQLGARGEDALRAWPRPGLQAEPRILFNPRLKSPPYMVPGVVAIVLLLVTTIVTAMGIAREKEMGTIEQLLITPIRPPVLLLGKILPFAFIGLVVAGAALAVGTHLFAIPVRGSLGTVALGTLLYLMTTLGVGVFISTVARTQQQAILGGMFFIMPAILLSGFATPIETMPDWIKPVTIIDPMRYYVEILRACLLKGAGFADMWRQLLALCAFGVAILGVASLRFRRQLQ